MQSAEMAGTRHPAYPASGDGGYAWSDRAPGIMGFGVPPFASATLSVELLCDRCKFKIVALTAC